MQGAVAQAPIKRPGLFSQKALQLWPFALTLTVQNETDITKLRDKFSACDGFEIKTVRGLGYKVELK